MTDPRDSLRDDLAHQVLAVVAMDRRRLAEAAVTRIALAASGLFVPAWLEAAAGEKPVRRVQRHAAQRRRMRRTRRRRNLRKAKQGRHNADRLGGFLRNF